MPLATRLAGTALLLGATLGLEARAEGVAYATAQSLRNGCLASGAPRATCTGYLMGVADILRHAAIAPALASGGVRVCPPPKLHGEQVRNLFLNHMHRNPDRAQLYLDTVGTVIVALDRQGNISRVNRRGCDLLGYSENELKGRSWFTTCLPRVHGKETRVLFDAALAGDGTFQYVSPAIQSFTGTSTQDAVGRKWSELFEVTTQTKETLDRSLEDLERGDPVAPYEASYVHPDRTVRTVEITERPEFVGSGRPIAVLGIVKDMTRRKQAEDELRRAATVFDSTDQGIMVTDPEGDVVLVNRAFTTITGFEPEDVLGTNPRFQKSGRQDAAYYERMWGSLAREGQWRDEIWNRRKNGEIYPAWENINAVKDEQGRVTNYVSLFSDISALKASEARLVHLAHHDALTNLPNRLRFMGNLEQAIEGARRHGHKVGLMYVAKSGGKNDFRYFTADLNRPTD